MNDPEFTFQLCYAQTQLHNIHDCRSHVRLSINIAQHELNVAHQAPLLKISGGKLQRLPLRLLPVQERLQNSNNPLQRCQPRLQLTLYLLLISLSPKLRIKILSIRTRRHRSAEDRLHHERMVGLEGVAVGGTEGGRHLFGGDGEVLSEGSGGEV